eukprot:scaffold31625_cov65-Cyclotella_meneghiniana.AAC.6
MRIFASQGGRFFRSGTHSILTSHLNSLLFGLTLWRVRVGRHAHLIFLSILYRRLPLCTAQRYSRTALYRSVPPCTAVYRRVPLCTAQRYSCTAGWR